MPVTISRRERQGLEGSPEICNLVVKEWRRTDCSGGARRVHSYLEGMRKIDPWGKVSRDLRWLQLIAEKMV